MRFKLVFLTVLILLTACSHTKNYHATFTGESDYWKGELVQNGKVTYRDHAELENQFEIDIKKNEKLTITFKGELSELGTEVEFSYRSKLGGHGSSTK